MDSLEPYHSAYSGEQVDSAIGTVRQKESTWDSKQSKLTGAAGQVVGFGTDGGALAVQGWGNPNLLDNWYFEDPVNQKGKTEYSGSHEKKSFLFDRWANWNSLTASINDGYVKLINEDTVDAYFNQIVETKSVPEVVVTASVLFADGAILYATGTIVHNPPTSTTVINVSSSNCRLDVQCRSRDILFELVVYSGQEVNIAAAKLELGSQQTLAHQNSDGSWVLNDPPPDKALELLKCQRYFQVFSEESLRPAKAMDFRPVMAKEPTLGTIEINGTTYYSASAEL